MKATKADGIFEAFIRKDDSYIFNFHTQCMYEKDGVPFVSKREIELEFDNNGSMSPNGDFAQQCMMMLEQFDDKTILEEEKDVVREMYFIGKLIDNIAYDVIVQTSFIRYYSSSDIEE